MDSDKGDKQTRKFSNKSKITVHGANNMAALQKITKVALKSSLLRFQTSENSSSRHNMINYCCPKLKRKAYDRRYFC